MRTALWTLLAVVAGIMTVSCVISSLRGLSLGYGLLSLPGFGLAALLALSSRYFWHKAKPPTPAMGTAKGTTKGTTPRTSPPSA